jgi:hypothetical protein
LDEQVRMLRQRQPTRPHSTPSLDMPSGARWPLDPVAEPTIGAGVKA